MAHRVRLMSRDNKNILLNCQIWRQKQLDHTKLRKFRSNMGLKIICEYNISKSREKMEVLQWRQVEDCMFKGSPYTPSELNMKKQQEFLSKESKNYKSFCPFGQHPNTWLNYSLRIELIVLEMFIYIIETLKTYIELFVGDMFVTSHYKHTIINHMPPHGS